MAHVRANCKNLSTTVSFDPTLLSLVDDHRFTTRKESRSMAIEELIKYGLKYIELRDKKRAARG